MKAIVTLASLFTIFGVACTNGQFRNIDARKASEMINSAHRPVVIDVRTPQEYTGELGNIPGSRLIPLQTLSDSVKSLLDFKDDEIILVCRSGNRSRTAGQILTAAGFRKVYNLEGGMKAWNAYHRSK